METRPCKHPLQTGLDEAQTDKTFFYVIGGEFTDTSFEKS